MKNILSIISVLSVFCATADAAVISIPNTGLDGSGNVLSDNAVDTNWTVQPAGGVVAQPLAVTSAGGFPVGPWLGDNADSAWISINEDTNGPPVDYTYQVAFSLAGLDPGTVSISGRWAADNSIADVLVNGVSTGLTATGFTAWTNFALSSADGHAFGPGDNILSVILNNAPPNDNPLALRVEFQQATADVIPEPTTGLLALVGALSVLRRRR